MKKGFTEIIKERLVGQKILLPTGLDVEYQPKGRALCITIIKTQK